ncbi:MAG: hypothetical protein PWQ86_1056, partial [Bacillota bacterium]|nr:hypothetical protein [Bacillota bacterium]
MWDVEKRDLTQGWSERPPKS